MRSFLNFLLSKSVRKNGLPAQDPGGTTFGRPGCYIRKGLALANFSWLVSANQRFVFTKENIKGILFLRTICPLNCMLVSVSTSKPAVFSSASTLNLSLMKVLMVFLSCASSLRLASINALRISPRLRTLFFDSATRSGGTLKPFC